MKTADRFSRLAQSSLRQDELNTIRGGKGNAGPGTTNDGSIPNVDDDVLYPD